MSRDLDAWIYSRRLQSGATRKQLPQGLSFPKVSVGVSLLSGSASQRTQSWGLSAPSPGDSAPPHHLSYSAPYPSPPRLWAISLPLPPAAFARLLGSARPRAAAGEPRGGGAAGAGSVAHPPQPPAPASPAAGPVAGAPRTASRGGRGMGEAGEGDASAE